MNTENATILNIGLIGIGLEEYWDQFDGLKKRLESNIDVLESRITNDHNMVFNNGMVDSYEKAISCGSHFKRNEVDVLLIYVTTYALSANVIPLVQRLKVPVFVLNVAPSAAIDYESFNALNNRTKMTREWLAYCSACPVPELANVFYRLNIPFQELLGVLDDPKDLVWTELNNWLKVIQVKKTLMNTKLGLMGHYYSGMMDIYTDLTAITASFGVHIIHLEVDELSEIRKSVSDDEVSRELGIFERTFEISKDCSEVELKRAANTAAALNKFVHKYDLGALAYFYKGFDGNSNYDTLSSIILGNSLLTANGIPVAGEFEIKNVVAMKIMDLFGAGGSFTEYYAIDFEGDIVLMGHDGPGHTAIAEGKAKVKPLEVYHGKVGKGLSIEMSVKNGPVTLLSVVEDTSGGFKLIYAEGQSEAGPILEIGNTNSRYRFAVGARNFVKAWNAQGPAHHCAIGIGHIGGKIEKLSYILGLNAIAIGQ